MNFEQYLSEDAEPINKWFIDNFYYENRLIKALVYNFDDGEGLSIKVMPHDDVKYRNIPMALGSYLRHKDKSIRWLGVDSIRADYPYDSFRLFIRKSLEELNKHIYMHVRLDGGDNLPHDKYKIFSMPSEDLYRQLTETSLSV